MVRVIINVFVLIGVRGDFFLFLNNRCFACYFIGFANVFSRWFVNKIRIVKNCFGIFYNFFNVNKHLGRRLISVLRVFLHCMNTNLLKTERNIRINFGEPFSIALKLHKSNTYCTFSFKRNFAGKHFIQNYTYGINVGLFISKFTFSLFRTDIMNRTDSSIRKRSRFASWKTSYTEIRNFNIPVW